MSNILVTGGLGFVGHNLVKRLKQEEHNIIVIDNKSSVNGNTMLEGVTYFIDSTENINQIHFPFKPEVVFHLGEYSRIHPSFEAYQQVFNTNVKGTFEIVDYCKRNDCKIIYAASSTKYAEEGVLHSPYAFTKANNVELIKGFSDWYGLKYAICYFYNVFGPGSNSSPVPGYESVIDVFFNQYKEGKPLTVVGSGLQDRYFTFVDDIVDGLVKAWKYELNDEFDLANEVRSYIVALAGLFSSNIVHVPERKGDRLTTVSNAAEAKYKLKWKTTKNVEDWIRQLIKQHESSKK
jgi:UDP-glucose 4-epimerase